ncbi:MAG: type II toxin-antitoxin system VapC family toxin [Lactovum sp.]
MGNRVLVTTDIILDFFTDRGEATRQAQIIIRGSLRGSYEIVISVGTLNAINYGLLGYGMTFLEVQECLSRLYQLVTVIEIEDLIESELILRDKAYRDKLTISTARRYGIEVIVTHLEINPQRFGISILSPERFLYIFKDLLE